MAARRPSLANNAITQLLAETKIETVLPERKDGLVVVYTTENLDKVVDVLASNKVLSVPVLDERHQCLGSLDVVAIANYVSSSAPDIMDGLPGAGTNRLRDVTLRSLIDHGHLVPTPYTSVPDSDTMLELTQRLCFHAHRVGVYAGDVNRLVNVMSQSDVVRFVQKHMNDNEPLRTLANTKLSALGCHQHRSLGVVSGSEPVVLALKTLVAHKWSALAVVDSHGHLMGNFSASDLRGLYKNQYPHFLTSVDKFLRQFSTQSLELRTVTLDDTLGQTLELLITTKLHRLWIVRDQKPVSVITLTDIMKIFCGMAV